MFALVLGNVPEVARQGEKSPISLKSLRGTLSERSHFKASHAGKCAKRLRPRRPQEMVLEQRCAPYVTRACRTPMQQYALGTVRHGRAAESHILFSANQGRFFCLWGYDRAVGGVPAW